jgi:UDP-N-acetylglucosamine transferase subunit ALG13
MIFLTVGTQLPFDRLVLAMDKWAECNSHLEITAQIGNSNLRPKHMRWKQFMAADEFRTKFESSGTIVAHAGMGTILTSLDLGKPVVIVPRLADLGEHRNDHQLATAKRFARFYQVQTVENLDRLGPTLDSLENLSEDYDFTGGPAPDLIAAVRQFVTGYGELR